MKKNHAINTQNIAIIIRKGNIVHNKLDEDNHK